MAVILLVCSSTLAFAQGATVINPANDTVRAKLGRIKIVDGAEMITSSDIVENIAASPEFSTLLNAIEAAGLTETFKSKGPITMFAPTNEAFDKLPVGELDTLLKPQHKLDLSYILTYHAVAGKLTAHDLLKKINAGNGQATLTTISGSQLTAKLDENRNIVLIDENGGQSIVSKFDIKQSNGILHVITAVLMPKIKSM